MEHQCGGHNQMGRQFLRDDSGINRFERSPGPGHAFNSIFFEPFFGFLKPASLDFSLISRLLNFLVPLPLPGRPGLPAPWAVLGSPCCCCCWPAAGGCCCCCVSPPAGGLSAGGVPAAEGSSSTIERSPIRSKPELADEKVIRKDWFYENKERRMLDIFYWCVMMLPR